VYPTLRGADACPPRAGGWLRVCSLDEFKAK
jgi:hypothetical protein